MICQLRDALFPKGRRGGNGVIRGNVTQLESKQKGKQRLLTLLDIKDNRVPVCCPL